MKKEETEVFDGELQYPAVKQLIEDPNLLGSIFKIINPNHFNQGYLRIAVGCMVDYYTKYGHTPNYNDLKFLMRDKLHSDDDEDFIKETIDKIKNSDNVSPVIAVDNLTKLSKVKYLGSIGKQVLELAKTGYWDERKARKLLEDYNKLFDTDKYDEIGRFDRINIIKSLTQGKEEIVPTGIKEIDDRIGGGLPKKEFGIFAAKQGAGKTTFGSVISHNAAVGGYKTIQLVFEDEIPSVERQHIAIELKKSKSVLKGLTDKRAEDGADFIEKQPNYSMINENLIIWHPQNETTIEDIERFIVDMYNRYNFQCEMLVIDYFGCIKHTTNPTKDKTTAEEQAMKKMKRIIAHKHDIAVWVLYQKNRTGASNVSRENYDPIAGVSGSYNATLDCSVWIDMFRTKEQKLNNRADLLFVKNRNAEEVEDFNDIYFNNGTLQIDCGNIINEDNELDKIYNEDEKPKFMLKFDQDQNIV